MPDAAIGVVLVNWNGADDTIAALDSLLETSPRPSRVVVVDNASRDDSVPRIGAWIREHSADGWVELYAGPANRGFPGGNNDGLALLARDPALDAFLLLNNDTVVARDLFARFADAMGTRPDAALFGPTIYEWDRTTVWYAGGLEHPLRALVTHGYDVPEQPEPRATGFVTGCAMLIPRRTYVRLGGLAEVYFPLYWEDAEYSLRAARLGPLVYVPAAVVYHKVSASVGTAAVSPRTAWVLNHHRALFVRRNYHGGTALAAAAYLLVTKPARMLVEIARGKPRIGWATLSGCLRGLFVTRPERGSPAIGTTPPSQLHSATN